MRLEIRHRTSYRYSGPVSLDRHVLRALPRCDGRQRLLSHRIEIDPPPVRRVDSIDDWGNTASQVWFGNATERLEIDVHLAVETRRSDPPPPAPIPLDYRSELAALRPYLEPLAPDEPMSEFTAGPLALSRGRASTLLDLLNRRVNDFYGHAVRLDGPARSPVETLHRGEGVCRDLAILLMAACRHLGIAARFVSGYQEAPASRSGDRRYLHAWAEVYLPGSGWHGYDPTHGRAADERNVAVACAPDPSAAAPVEGSFRFTGAPPTSTLDTEVSITRRASGP